MDKKMIKILSKSGNIARARRMAITRTSTHNNHNNHNNHNTHSNHNNHKNRGSSRNKVGNFHLIKDRDTHKANNKANNLRHLRIIQMRLLRQELLDNQCHSMFHRE